MQTLGLVLKCASYINTYTLKKNMHRYKYFKLGSVSRFALFSKIYTVSIFHFFVAVFLTLIRYTK